MKELKFSDGTGEIDKTLFYKNDFSISCADPGCLYVSEKDDPINGGWFYMYSTGHCDSKDGDCAYTAFPCYRSRDLGEWEKAGAANGHALKVKASDWAEKFFWAPEVIRDPESGKYYMYFSAGAKKGDATSEYTSETEDMWACLYLGIAVSDSPVGPFTMAEGVNLDGDEISGKNPPFNFEKKLGLSHYWSAIDISPFIAPDGTLYVYFAKHVDKFHNCICVYGMKMKDFITPDYSTVTKLTHPSVLTGAGKAGDVSYFDKGAEKIDEGNVNEGPFMTFHDGKYYLTYSPFGYGSRRYAIMQAVSDSPLGPFVKIPYEEGNPVIGINSVNDYMAGTGHHNFAYTDKEMWAVYHAHRDPVEPCDKDGKFKGRVLAVDRVGFVYNQKLGFDILRGFGPTASLQPLAEVNGNCENLARSAKITSSAIGDTQKYLNDGFIAVHPFSAEEEAEFKGSAEITFTFDKPKEIRAVMAYNSISYGCAFSRINAVTLSLNGEKSVIKNIPADPADVNREKRFMRAGCSAKAVFKPIKADEVKIVISSKYDDEEDAIKISEIVILGK